MSSSSKRRITHIGKNEESQPMYDDIVSGIIKEMDSNNYGENFNFNLRKQHESVDKTKTFAPIYGQNKYSNKQTKYLLEKKHPLMEKTQKSLKYLKHNQKIPKQRAHVSALESNKFDKDTKLMPQNRAIKKQRPMNNTSIAFSSNKKNEVKDNLNTSELIRERNNLKKDTPVTSDSNELNYNNPSSSDPESEYEHFIQNHKVVSTDESDVSSNKSIKLRQKKKFKRIQTYSDSESDSGNLTKVNKEITCDSDKNVKKKRKKKVKNKSKKKLKSNTDKKNSCTTKNMLSVNKTKDYLNKELKSMPVLDETSKMDFDGIENLDTLKLTTEPKTNYSTLKKGDFQTFVSDFTLSLNEPGVLNYISKHFECFVTLKRNPFLDQEVLSDVLLENKSEHGNTKNNQNNMSDNLQHMLSKNEGIVNECLIVESNLVKEISVNNISNPIDNTLSNLPNTESDDDECLILENNLDSINKSEIDEECVILCTVPKFPQNSSETCISNIKTGHKESDNYPEEVSNFHADESDLEVNIQILSVKSLGDDKSSYSASSDIIDNTLLLNKNENSSYIDISSNVENCNSEVFSSQSERLKINTLNSKSFSKINKDYFKYAKRYCDLISDKSKHNKANSKPLDSPCIEPLCIDLEDSNGEEKCENVEITASTCEIDKNVTNERFGLKYDVIQSIDKDYLKNILQTVFKETDTHSNITVCETGKYVNDNRHISSKNIFLEKLDKTQNKCTMRDVGIQNILHNYDYISQNIGSHLCNPIESGETFLAPSSGKYQNDFPETITAKPKTVANFVEETSDELDNAASSHIYELCETEKTDLIPLFKLYAKEMDSYKEIMEIKIESPGIKILKKKQIEKINSLQTAIHNIIIQDPCFHEVLKKAFWRR